MTAQVDIIFLGSFVGAIIVLCIPIGFIIKCYYKVNASLAANTKATKDSKKERRVMLEGLLACLHGMKEQGFNGPVTAGINAIDLFMIEQLHEEKEE